MDTLSPKTLNTSRGYAYKYYISPKTQHVDPKLPTIFLQHGFPDDAYMWQFIVPHLLKLPYRLVIPDLLGYGGTSKPAEAEAYNHEDTTKEFIEILDAEGIDKVISVGHDWGSAVAQRFYLYHPDRVAGVILLNVGYLPPVAEPFDLDKINQLTEQVFGYPIYSYWELFTAPDAPQVLGDNLDRAWEVWHGADDEWMKKMFCVKGAMRKYLTDHDSYTVELKPYAKDTALKKAWIERIQKDGIDAPLNYYRAHASNVQYKHEKKFVGGQDVINVPVLFIGCTNDAVCRADGNVQPKANGLLPDLEEVVIESGHWSPFEKPDEIADAMVAWLTKRFPMSA